MNKLFLMIFLALFFCSCSAGPSTLERGESDVSVGFGDSTPTSVVVNQSFTTTFAVPLNAASVNTSTFFIVKNTVSSSISPNKFGKATVVNNATCNSASAIAATITRSGTGDCDTSFTITPSANLEYNAKYTFCGTSGISTCDPNLHGVFKGFMEEFTTAAETGGGCVESTGCTSTCGATGYSDDGNVSCYSESTCATACVTDTTAPTVTITSAESTLTATSPFSVTITFSEEVSGFEVSDITVSNGTASNLVATTANKVYTASITPSANPSTVGVSVAAGVATDAASNANTASDSFSIRYDTSALTVTVTSAATDPTNSSPFAVTITFSEAVTGFALSDISVTNGSAGNLNSTSNPTFTADITPTTNGAVTTSVGASVAVDTLTGAKSNTASADFSITYDGTAPSVETTTPANGATAVAVATTIAVTFDEAMDVTSITTNTSNTTCSGSLQLSTDNFTTCIQMTASPVASNSNKTFTITPLASLAGETLHKIKVTTSAKDAAGNASGAAVKSFTTADITAPQVSSTTPADEATSIALDSTVAVVFNEAMDVSTLTTNTADTTCSGSFQVSADNFTTCAQMAASPVASNSDKTFTVTPTSNLSPDATYKIKITTAVTDAAGNPLASTYTLATGFAMKVTVEDYLHAYSTGDRTAAGTNLITVTATVSVCGTITDLVNGLNENETGPCDADAAGDYMRFALNGDPAIFTEAKWFQSGTSNHNNWQWQGSNNGTDWTNIGSAFVLGGAMAQTMTELAGNTTAYSYYQLLGQAGAIGNAATWVREIQFQVLRYE